MEEQVRDPREDISYIRGILERAADGMGSAAPYFTRFGVVWLVYGILCAALRFAQSFASPAAVPILANVGAAAGWLFYIVLAAGFFAVRRRQRRNGLNTLAMKLMDIWGACILAFLFLCVVLSVVTVLAVRGLAFSAEAMTSLGYTLAVCRSFLFFLLPALPLIITALFLENRRMLRLGIVLSALAAVFLGSHIVLVWGGSASGLSVPAGWAAGWNIAACLLDIIPGVMLLLFGRSLKRG